jgi:hypothetical protein
LETAVITGISLEICAIKKEMKKSEMKKYHNPRTVPGGCNDLIDN